MGWSAGNPDLPAAPGRPDPVRGGRSHREIVPPAAWVPPSARMDREAVQRSRIDALLFLLSGTVYLVLVGVLVVVANLQQMVGSSAPLPSDLGTIRDLLAVLGWLGLWGVGLLLHFLPSQIGLPYRPLRIARLHLVLVQIGLVEFAVAALGWGLGPAAEVGLLLAGLSYLLFALPLLLVLILAVQDWMADGL